MGHGIARDHLASILTDDYLPLGLHVFPSCCLVRTNCCISNAIPWLLEGFGKHDPGKGRYNGLSPKWDFLHTGHAWALKCKLREETQKEIQREVQSYLSTAAPPATPHSVGRQDL